MSYRERREAVLQHFLRICVIRSYRAEGAVTRQSYRERSEAVLQHFMRICVIRSHRAEGAVTPVSYRERRERSHRRSRS